VNADKHRAKAERIGQTLAKCRPAEDHEVIIDGVMLAASHWVNTVLHSSGLTPEHVDFMHSYYLAPYDRQNTARVAGPELLDALEEIENLRPLHVRGAAPGGEAAALRALELLRVVRETAARFAGPGSGGPARPEP
jgi:hypothetical protein